MLDRLERRFGRLGVPNLILYVAAGRGLALLLSLSRPEFRDALALDPYAVRHGEPWRLVSYLFMPPALLSGIFGGVFGAAIQLYFTWLIGRLLENAWGAFRFTLYYAVGGIGTAVAAVFFFGLPATPDYLDLSLFLAFATVFPDFTVYLFFILPVAMKWLGWFAAAGLIWDFLVHANTAGRLGSLAAFANYLLFFGPGLLRRTPRRVVAAAVVPLAAATAAPAHRCVTCGRTERDEPTLEFRWCACERCGEGKEYCLEDLAKHRGT